MHYFKECTIFVVKFIEYLKCYNYETFSFYQFTMLNLRFERM